MEKEIKIIWSNFILCDLNIQIVVERWTINRFVTFCVMTNKEISIILSEKLYFWELNGHENSIFFFNFVYLIYK